MPDRGAIRRRQLIAAVAILAFAPTTFAVVRSFEKDAAVTTALDLAHAPFFTEQLEVRRRDSESFARGLERNGPRAVAQFARAEEIWAERVRAARSRPE